ncbi:MAG: hypothetical protein IPN18_21095 [Ignavibacteriales bacterium]|jgi:hypothetical protein|nr:hypothetical protein [Ignavibacteriales bacterium]
MKSTVFLITILISLFLTACSCPVCDIVDNRYPKTLKMIGVPEKIKEKVDNYIAAKTGEDFFVKYVSLNETASFFDSVKYYWVYDISIPGKEWVTGKIDLFTDSLGNIDQLMEVNGIPDCGTNPNGCSFDITPNQAFKIAIKEGLKPGIKEWSQKFLWNAKFNRYVWQIISTLEESQGSQGFRGSGEEIIIDASTGEKLDINEWKVR